MSKPATYTEGELNRQARTHCGESLRSDADIMAEVQGGDWARFAELVSRYETAMLRTAWSRLGDRQWAEDVVQDAFVGAFVARASFNPAFSFRAWLWTILLNLCKKQWKRRARRPGEQPFHQTEFHEPATGNDGLECLLHAEKLDRVRQLLAALPEDQADAVRLRFFGELTYQEIATALGCALNTAKSRVRYGLEHLADQLREKNGDVHEL